jgi:hypothetical protein
MQFDRDIQPVNSPVTNAIQYAMSVFNIAAGIYKVSIRVAIRYKDSTETPGTLSLLLDALELPYTVSQLDNTLSFD